MVGAGHNALVSAAYLARAGLSVVVLERAERVGGAAVSEPVWPGYTVSTGAYVCSLLDPQIVDDLDLAAHGYSAYRKEPASFTPLLDGRSLLLGGDDAENAREIGAFDRHDVAGFAEFERVASALGSLVAGEFMADEPSFERFDASVQAQLRGSAADLAEAHVHTPVLAATLATDGLIGTAAGPRDRGTGYVLAHHYAGRALGVQGVWGFVRGGMGAVSDAIAAAAQAAGATIRTNAPVASIDLRDARASGVELANGERIEARCVLSGADPKTTFLQLVPSNALEPGFIERVRGWRCAGVSFKLNLALGELPDFTARPGRGPLAHHRATIHVAPTIDYLQAAFDDARTGFSRKPMLECFMQTPTDPSLAPPGKHILSIFAQYFPYEPADGPWTPSRRDAVVDSIIATLAQYAPNLPRAVEATQALAPPDLEARFGLAGGHIFHGDLLPGQIFEGRFAARTPVKGLYLCGSGTHPGGCVSGAPGRRATRAVLQDLAAHSIR
ncbi:MAG TPA: NAD(P)/FAD-dependent oxidoreductase [Candidatus Binatia bacterium]|nr:NAD(P)/FAD-dependent oxidoreductase [Candidatus Binatia bacterium]